MLDQQRQEALAASRLSALPGATLERMTADSALLDAPAGTVLHRVGSTSPFLCVVAEGTLRTSLISEQGRQLTVRYSRPGDLVGLAGVYAGQSPRLSIQAVTHSRLLLLRPETVRKLAATDAGLASALLVDLAEHTADSLGALAAATLPSLRQDVVRHLLDAAESGDNGDSLVARLSPQQLAEHVGSPREVVGRILRDLKNEGLVSNGKDAVVVLDADRLNDLAWPRAYR
jgi:CRP/FNR family transcriptional regulator, cyclic AMP receptor protein